MRLFLIIVFLPVQLLAAQYIGEDKGGWDEMKINARLIESGSAEELLLRCERDPAQCADIQPAAGEDIECDSYETYEADNGLTLTICTEIVE